MWPKSVCGTHKSYIPHIGSVKEAVFCNRSRSLKLSPSVRDNNSLAKTFKPFAEPKLQKGFGSLWNEANFCLNLFYIPLIYSKDFEAFYPTLEWVLWKISESWLSLSQSTFFRDSVQNFAAMESSSKLQRRLAASKCKTMAPEAIIGVQQEKRKTVCLWFVRPFTPFTHSVSEIYVQHDTQILLPTRLVNTCKLFQKFAGKYLCTMLQGSWNGKQAQQKFVLWMCRENEIFISSQNSTPTVWSKDAKNSRGNVPFQLSVAQNLT